MADNQKDHFRSEVMYQEFNQEMFDCSIQKVCFFLFLLAVRTLPKLVVRSDVYPSPVCQ